MVRHLVFLLHNLRWPSRNYAFVKMTVLHRFLQFSSKLFQNSPQLQEFMQQNIRNASKKAGGSTRNKQGQTPGKSRGAKKLEGDYVERNMVLYKQLGLKVYPGENVKLDTDMSLLAMEPGYVVISQEVLRPYPDSPLYPSVKAGQILHKLFYHVIPEPQHQTFKLVSQA